METEKISMVELLSHDKPFVGRFYFNFRLHFVKILEVTFFQSDVAEFHTS